MKSWTDKVKKIGPTSCMYSVSLKSSWLYQGTHLNFSVIKASPTFTTSQLFRPRFSAVSRLKLAMRSSVARVMTSRQWDSVETHLAASFGHASVNSWLSLSAVVSWGKTKMIWTNDFLYQLLTVEKNKNKHTNIFPFKCSLLEITMIMPNVF